jgi:hypothetical protein
MNQIFAQFSQKLHILLKTDAEISPKAQKLKLMPLPFRDEFLDPNETYLVFVNINLNLVETESTLVFFLKINTFNHVSCEPFKKLFKTHLERMA